MSDFQQERELIEQVQQGKAGAFERLYASYKDRAYHTAVFLIGDTEDAQDVVQDTFITVYFQIKKLKEPSAFRSWFYRILTRNAMHVSQKRQKEILQDEMQEVGLRHQGMEDLSDILMKQEEQKRLRHLIDGLDEKHRTVLVLYYYNEFSIEQIARITGCLQGTVKSRLFHARKQLEKKLKEEERR